MQPVRLQKYLAECGIASRRACEKLIEEGAVQVDGVTVTEPGVKVNPERQSVFCRGKHAVREEKIWLVLNKPPGVICTSSDPAGRERVLDLLPALPGRVYTVGRLDVMSEGLILVTNDGELAHRLMHPRHHLEKKYQVWIDQGLTDRDMSSVLTGIRSRGEVLRALKIEPLRRPGPTGSFGCTLTLGEGRNRHIRRMMESLDRKVIRLIRVSIGPLRLERLRQGEYRSLAMWEVKKLRSAAGLNHSVQPY